MPTTINLQQGNVKKPKPKIYTYIIRSFGTIQKVDTSSPPHTTTLVTQRISLDPQTKKKYFFGLQFCPITLKY